jgi:hypothetical protein
MLVGPLPDCDPGPPQGCDGTAAAAAAAAAALQPPHRLGWPFRSRAVGPDVHAVAVKRALREIALVPGGDREAGARAIQQRWGATLLRQAAAAARAQLGCQQSNSSGSGAVCVRGARPCAVRLAHTGLCWGTSERRVSAAGHSSQVLRTCGFKPHQARWVRPPAVLLLLGPGPRQLQHAAAGAGADCRCEV